MVLLIETVQEVTGAFELISHLLRQEQKKNVGKKGKNLLHYFFLSN